MVGQWAVAAAVASRLPAAGGGSKISEAAEGMEEHPGTGRKQESKAPVQYPNIGEEIREGARRGGIRSRGRWLLTEDGEGGYREEPPSRGHRVPRAAANGRRREEEGIGAAPLSARARQGRRERRK